jgi:hypothetical protein
VRDGVVGLLEAGEIPKVRKIAALLRLHGLHGAIAIFEKNTTAIRLFLQHQPRPVMTQAREALDEFILAQVLGCGEPGDFFIRQAHLSRPATAGGATLIFKKDRHALASVELFEMFAVIFEHFFHCEV